MDANKDGTLDRDELKQLLIMSGEEVTREKTELIYTIIDEDNSGKIDIFEFIDNLNFD